MTRVCLTFLQEEEDRKSSDEAFFFSMLMAHDERISSDSEDVRLASEFASAKILLLGLDAVLIDWRSNQIGDGWFELHDRSARTYNATRERLTH